VLLREHSVPMVERGALSPPMDINGVTIEFLHPPPGVNFSANNGSLTLRLTYGTVSILFPGDVEEDGEREIVGAYRGRDLKGSVLKVPHHGSRTSSTAPFLNAVQPAVAIFSVGRNNPFGFPHPEVVERYRAAGTVTYRTDRDGAVEVGTDGETIEVEGFRHKRPSLFPPHH